MNPDTGHLVEILDGVAPDGRSLEKLLEGEYQEIPEPLNLEARNKLAGQRETYVNLRDDSPLSQWAADQRRHKEKKRRRNRHKRKEAKRYK